MMFLDTSFIIDHRLEKVIIIVKSYLQSVISSVRMISFWQSLHFLLPTQNKIEQN